MNTLASAPQTDSSISQHIVLASYGTLGDVFPFIQLGNALTERGYRVTLASSELYRAQAVACGLTFVQLRPDLTASGLPLEEFAGRVMDPAKGMSYVYRELLMPNLRNSYADLIAVTHDADLLVTHPLVLAAPLAAEKTGIRWISTVLSPLSFMSRYDPSIMTANQFPDPHRLSPFLVGLIIQGIKWALRSWTTPIQQFRAELGLPARPNPLFEGQHAPDRVLALFSSAFVAPQPDWPQQARTTGFIFNNYAPAEPLSPALRDFLASGPAPVVFTLGSSAIFTAGRFFAESVAAVRRMGCRAVLITGGFSHEGLDDVETDPSILVVDYVPHGIIFDRASVIVHQGGIGTVGQSLRAGRPMLVVPHAHDQPDNALRIQRLGVGRMLPANHYSADRVVTELTALLQQPTYQLRATQLRKQVMTEDGAQTACLLIEEQLTATR
ncbi:glycosyltransferase [Spirosoma fluminis]